jgi:hypothetical protein
LHGCYEIHRNVDLLLWSQPLFRQLQQKTSLVVYRSSQLLVTSHVHQSALLRPREGTAVSQTPNLTETRPGCKLGSIKDCNILHKPGVELAATTTFTSQFSAAAADWLASKGGGGVTTTTIVLGLSSSHEEE